MRANSLRAHRWIPAYAALALLALLAVFLMQNGQPAPAHAQGEDACALAGDPRNFQATAGHGKLVLTWDEPATWRGWDGEGRRYYVLKWRQAGSGWEYNIIGDSRIRNPPTDAYTFTGTYREERGSDPAGNHTVTNGTAYEFLIQAVYVTSECGRVNGYEVSASGTPAASQEALSADATLSGLELENATFGSTRSEAPVGLGADENFNSDQTDYYALVLKEIGRVTVKPTATAGNDATIRVWLTDGPDAHNVASGSSSSAINITPKADSSVPHVINVKVIAEDGATTKTYRIRVWQLDPISFGGATVDDIHFTAGVDVPELALPKITDVTSTYTQITYTATGLPAGLDLGLLHATISGTPEAATTNPVTVTYTAHADEIGSSASLTFQVTVAPPVVFDADQLAVFNDDLLLIEYTIGQTGRLNVTLPSASGGHGELTYHLTYDEEVVIAVNEDDPKRSETSTVEKTVNDDAPGFSFDAATRVLTSDTGGSEPSETAVYSLVYSAVDVNGSRAVLQSGLAVREAPTLGEIADQTFTVGVAASITLPEAEGGSAAGLTSMYYTLSPEVDGLAPPRAGSSEYDHENLAVGRELVGTPVIPGSTLMTYTVTDANGVTDTETFTITVVNGPSAPSSAPASLQANHVAGANAGARWNAVTGATGYVVQVIEAGGSFPDKPLNSVPDNVALSFDDHFPTQAVFAVISPGDYKVRVAARNEDGVGPWSAEASFTVKVGGV